MASNPTCMDMPGIGRLTTLAVPLALWGCSPQQSALHPAGEEAEGVASLFWHMAGAGALIWVLVIGAAIYAVVGRRRPSSERFADRFIVAGGVIFPTVALAALLVFSLSLLPAWTQDEPPDLRVHITARQYFWQVEYERPDGSRVASANEVHVPADRTIEFVLESPDVIHSFWIPALGGKMDAIPGRTNVLRLTPTKAGLYRGVCAEFCGPSHALMAFSVEVREPAAFESWVEAQGEEANVAAQAFSSAGCGGCHTIRGVSELASVGPDLTHFAGRRTIAAATLVNTPENLRRWLVDPQGIKPGTHMPSYAMLPEAELDAIVDFLGELH
jgi:cytochrome c oxidase subunit II